ncbi:MAG: MarR family transcriptional regulator [Gemmatimonadota bacterium]
MSEPLRQVPSGTETTLVLRKASRAIDRKAILSIEETGLCFSDFAVLEALLHKGPLPVNVLGKKVFLTTGSITTAVNRLASRGLVKRQDATGDRRIRIVHLTDLGHTVIRPLFARHAQDLDLLVSILTAEERMTLVALLRKLGTSVDGLNSTNK